MAAGERRHDIKRVMTVVGAIAVAAFSGSATALVFLLSVAFILIEIATMNGQEDDISRYLSFAISDLEAFMVLMVPLIAMRVIFPELTRETWRDIIHR